MYGSFAVGVREHSLVGMMADGTGFNLFFSFLLFGMFSLSHTHTLSALVEGAVSFCFFERSQGLMDRWMDRWMDGGSRE